MSKAAPVTFAEYDAKYAEATVTAKHVGELEKVCAQIKSHQSRYNVVAAATDMPWWVIACIHSRESSLNFTTYLQNGDPLFNHLGHAVPTVHVPHGVGPFQPQTWENAAIRALGGIGSHKGSPTTVGYWLSFMETYNGLGYRHRGVSSPYIWNYTNQYVAGKYVADGVFDPHKVDQEPGVAAIMKELGIK